MKVKLKDIVFVGAGPGDPELITVKGKKLLEEADLVIYAGSLVNPQILSYCKESCAILDSASMNLEEQVESMVTAAQEDKAVVRLHTGDPSLYGAVEEQKRMLLSRGMNVRFVPGVSSLQGAASALGIQYTIPGETQTLICTRREGRTPVPESESLPLLASHGSTMVIFLSAAQADRVCQDLIDGGRSPETPAACVYRATWEDEIVIRSTLAELSSEMKKRGINRQALIIAGDCIDPAERKSLLYDKTFTHGYRKGRK